MTYWLQNNKLKVDYARWTKKWKTTRKHHHFYFLHFAISLRSLFTIYLIPKYSFFLKMLVGEILYVFITVQCPRCQIEHKAYFISSRKQWQCKHCQHRFSVKSGTIFQHTKLSLKKLLLSVYYFTINSKGISALNLSRHIGVQYKNVMGITT